MTSAAKQTLPHEACPSNVTLLERMNDHARPAFRNFRGCENMFDEFHPRVTSIIRFKELLSPLGLIPEIIQINPYR